MKSSETYSQFTFYSSSSNFMVTYWSSYILNIANIAICDTVSSVVTVKTISVKNEVIRDLNLHFNINLWLILHQYCLHMWYCLSSVIMIKTISVKNEAIRDLNLHFNINLWLILHQYCLHMWYCLICDHDKDNFSEEWSHQRPKFTF